MSLAKAQDKSGFELVRQFRNCLLIGGYGPEGTSLIFHVVRRPVLKRTTLAQSTVSVDLSKLIIIHLDVSVKCTFSPRQRSVLLLPQYY